MLAGISADYYLRLEQGRDSRPSAEVLDALATALRLDRAAAGHLHSLSYPAAARLRTAEHERAPESIERLIELWPRTPTFVHSRHMDVLAANALCTALCPIFKPGVNTLRAVFLDPEPRRIFRDWQGVAEATVARVRTVVGPNLDDPRLEELVAELSERSPEFRRLWARHDVQVASARSQIYDHPLVGPLELKPDRLMVVESEGQTLIVQHAEPGSASALALDRLAQLVAAEAATHEIRTV